jgi:GT2 family glycosyltransferase
VVEASSLRASVVIFRPDLPELEATLRTLAVSADAARRSGALGAMTLDIVDNGSHDESAVDACVARAVALMPAVSVRTIRGQGNVGYGEGHNISIKVGTEDVHLVLNPDVALSEAALTHALVHLSEHPNVALVAPSVRGRDGVRQYLCRRYPSVLVLVLRGFAPRPIARLFQRQLYQYEMRDCLGDGADVVVPLVSGCCMFVNGVALRRIGGFSPAFFLYFEDYDLSLRLAQTGELVYVPKVQIVHHGGNAARKGGPHVRLFMRSAATFFRRHGWRWV